MWHSWRVGSMISPAFPSCFRIMHRKPRRVVISGEENRWLGLRGGREVFIDVERHYMLKKKKVFKACYISATNGQCMGHIHLHYVIWFSQQPADRSRAGMLGPHFTDSADIRLLLPWLGHAVASLWSSARCPEFYPGAILAPCDSPRSTFHVTPKSCAPFTPELLNGERRTRFTHL